MKNLVAILILVPLFVVPVSAQKHVWQLYTIDEQPYYPVVLDSLAGDTLIIHSAGKAYKMSLANIKYLKRQRQSRAGVGLLAGVVAGGLAANWFARQSRSNENSFTGGFADGYEVLSTIVGCLAGGALGAVIGQAAGADVYLDLQNMSPEKRRRLVAMLVAPNP